MNEKKSNDLMGVIMLVLGILFVINAFFNVTSIIFFRGWLWALVCAVSIYHMIQDGRTKKNTFWAVTGAILFINARTGILGFIIGKLILPVIFLAIGISILTKNHRSTN